MSKYFIMFFKIFLIILFINFFNNICISEVLLIRKDGKEILGLLQIDSEQFLDCNCDMRNSNGGKFIPTVRKCPDRNGVGPLGKHNIDKILLVSFGLMEKGNFDTSQKLLDTVLKLDPGNPLALNNLAAIMIKQNKFDKADAYLNQALPRAKEYKYMVQVNRVCQVGGLCVAFKPAAGKTGNQDIEPLIKMNIDMLKQYMSAEPFSGKGPR